MRYYGERVRGAAVTSLKKEKEKPPLLLSFSFSFLGSEVGQYEIKIAETDEVKHTHTY